MVKKFTKHVFLTIIILVIVVFITGILVGRSIRTAGETEIEKFIKNAELNTESYLIEQELVQNFDEDSCEIADLRISALTEELGAIGRKLTDSADELSARNFNFLKRKYHLMQARTYFLLNKLVDNCDIPNNVILYYYSADDEDSVRQGPLLDSIVEDYDVTVFAMEHGYSSELEFLEQYYGVETTPTLIINYDTKMEGFSGYDDVENALK